MTQSAKNPVRHRWAKMKFKKTELKKYVGETAVRGIPNRPEKNLFSTSSVFMLAMIDFHILWQMLLLSLSAPIWIRVRHHITTTKTKLSSHILIKLNYIVRFNLQYCGLIIKTIN